MKAQEMLQENRYYAPEKGSIWVVMESGVVKAYWMKFFGHLNYTGLGVLNNWLHSGMVGKLGDGSLDKERNDVGNNMVAT